MDVDAQGGRGSCVTPDHGVVADDAPGGMPEGAEDRIAGVV